MTGAPVPTILCPACRNPQPGSSKFCFKCGSDMILNNAGPRYYLTRVIKQGGQGAVYEGVGQDGTVYAVKEMLEQFASPKERDEAVMRFEAEADLLQRLRHPGIPRVYASFTDDNRRYLVMDFVRGDDLEHVVGKQGAIPEAAALEWARQICDVLAYLHGQKPPIIFRDIKPSNIMLRPDGRIQLVDFGIAKVLQSAVRGTQIGTPGYAPPEQYQGLATDASDVYALCATLHHLLTGRDPQNEAPFSFPSLRSLKPAISERTDRAVARGLQMRPEDRYQSIDELWADLNPTPQAAPQSGPTKVLVAGTPTVAAQVAGTAQAGKSTAAPAQTAPPPAKPAQTPAQRPPQTKPAVPPVPPPPQRPGPAAAPAQPARGGGRALWYVLGFLLVLVLGGATVALLPGGAGILRFGATPTPLRLVQQTFAVNNLEIIPPDTSDQALRKAYLDAYLALARQKYGSNIQILNNSVTLLGAPVKVRDDPKGPVYRANVTGFVLVPQP